MKKIGIMTWYKYQNYGTALQASAMYYKISQLGYQPEMIQYTPKGRLDLPEKIDAKYVVRKAVAKLRSRKSDEYTSPGKAEKFERFIQQHLTESEQVDTYPELCMLNAEYDGFVCGSDQIWSPLCYDDKYFLSFVENKWKRVAYAPSLGCEKIANPLIRDNIATQLNGFEHLSIREEQGAALIQSLTGKQAKVVADPTLLLDRQEWDQLIPEPKHSGIPAGKYILCYFLGDASRYEKFVRELSKVSGLDVYIIPVTQADQGAQHVVPFDVGPAEFVSLLRNAAYVCTDSFHGMAFSINYNIPFSVFKRFADNDPRNQNSRIFSLLTKMELMGRLTDPQKDLAAQIDRSCDFSRSNQLLHAFRESSLEYLRTALSSAVDAPAEKDGVYRITDLCCGCGACAASCPVNAISIVQNEEGFQQYHIDGDKCIRCGKCRRICPMKTVTAMPTQQAQSLWSVKSKSEQVLRTSSSGGIGYEMTRMAQSKGYHVAGCVYNAEQNRAEHIVIPPEDAQGLHLLQGSKYIQSHSADAISQICTIAAQTNVLFVGTPCQVAGVDHVLRSNGVRDHAILVDLICHGVPSQHLWDRYLEDIHKQFGTGAHPQVEFRYSKCGWRNMSIMISGDGKQYVKAERKDHFYAFFRRGLCYSRSCFDCPYRQRSAADLRIGDYWGPRFVNDNTGVSMVMACTQTGADFLKEISNCSMEQQELSEYWTVQYPYNQPRPLVHQQLLKDLQDKEASVGQLRKRYCEYYDRSETISEIKSNIKRLLR